MIVMQGGAGQGKFAVPLVRGCFLLLMTMMTMQLMMMMSVVQGFNIRQSPFTNAMGMNVVRFRGVRSALMHPTAMVFSSPKENPTRQQQIPTPHLGSSSTTTLMTPGAASRDHSPQLQPQHEPNYVTPAVTPPPRDLRDGHMFQGTSGFNSNGNSGLGPKWLRSGNNGGWAGQRTHGIGGGNAFGGGWAVQRRPLNTSHDSRGTERHDTYGRPLNEDLSHLQDRPTGSHQQRAETPTDADMTANHERATTVFRGGSHHLPPWAMEEREIQEDRGTEFTVSEYQPDDYSVYHDYGNTNYRLPDQTANPPRPLTLEHVMDMQNLSKPDLLSLLEQRGITIRELNDFLDDGASEKDVVEFLQPSATGSVLTTTVQPSDVGYQDDVRVVPVPPAEPESDTEEENRESKEQRKNRRKGRKGKGGRRKKTRKNKKHRESDTTTPPEVNTTLAPTPHPRLPNTLPETVSTTTLATRDILFPTTAPTSTPPSSTPPLVKTSDVAIVSVTLFEASEKEFQTPRLTFIEGALPLPPRKRKPSWEETHEVETLMEEEEEVEEEVSFVREKHRDDYVFPLRGLLIVSGLMGALVVFTLVVLVSYAVVKCTKKPAVNNYQVSQHQTPAGT